MKATKKMGRLFGGRFKSGGYVNAWEDNWKTKNDAVRTGKR